MVEAGLELDERLGVRMRPVCLSMMLMLKRRFVAGDGSHRCWSSLRRGYLWIHCYYSVRLVGEVGFLHCADAVRMPVVKTKVAPLLALLDAVDACVAYPVHPLPKDHLSSVTKADLHLET